VYQQAPYQAISEEEYKEAVKNMPKQIDWSLLSAYESEDNTEGVQQLACSAGVCEI
jgi:ribonucleoside-diphosphate reductase alpha chain